MKKGIFLLTLMFILGCSTVGLAASVATFSDSSGPSVNGTLANFRCSKNVEIHVISSAQSYSAVSGHLNGNREFGTVSGDSKIYYEGKAKGTAIADEPSANGTTIKSWSSL